MSKKFRYCWFSKSNAAGNIPRSSSSAPIVFTRFEAGYVCEIQRQMLVARAFSRDSCSPVNNKINILPDTVSIFRTWLFPYFAVAFVVFRLKPWLDTGKSCHYFLNPDLLPIFAGCFLLLLQWWVICNPVGGFPKESLLFNLSLIKVYQMTSPSINLLVQHYLSPLPNIKAKKVVKSTTELRTYWLNLSLD